MHSRFPLLPWLLVLGSCNSPPKPPTVDESTRRPANNPQAVELQVCKGDLREAQIAIGEASRQIAYQAATMERLVAHQRAAAAVPVVAPSNDIYTVRFAFGSSRVAIPSDIASDLIEKARTAPLVVVRGRTDGHADTAAEARIARDRAVAVRDHLTTAGVDPARVRVTYQASGDHVADNATSEGRAANRRVEIEVYRAEPVAAATHAAAQH